MFGERDNQFFRLFETAAANVAEAAQVLSKITRHPGDKEAMTAELESLEHRGDELTHDLIAELNRAFITPIDREDIFLIAKETDNVIDAIEATAHRFIMLDVNDSTPAAQELARLIDAGAKELVNVMRELRRPKSIACDNRCVVEINRLEDEGDRIYRDAVKKLYADGGDILAIIKWREIYDHLEDTLDALEDVANIVEGIAMKHA
ncbi:MAG: DUF47 domain-containing protein [Bacteroidota bacterium]